MRIRFGRAVSALAVIAATVLGTVACSSAATSSSSSDGDPLAAAKEFYRGKTITFIVGNAAGSTPATAMSLIKEPMEKYLGATLNMTFSNAAAIASEDQVGTALADGLTIGELSLGSALVAEYAGAGAPSFDLTQASFMGAVVQSPDLLVACANSPIRTIDDLVSGKYPVSMVNQKVANNGLVGSYILNAWDIEDAKWNFYGNSADQTAGCARGDGNVSVGNVGAWMDASGAQVTPGLTPLLLLGSVDGFASEDSLEGVPTLDEYVAKNPPKTDRGKQAVALLQAMFTQTAPSFVIFGPPGIDDGYRQLIADAMRSAMADPEVQAKYKAVQTPPIYVAPEDVRTAVAAQLGSSTDVIKTYLP